MEKSVYARLTLFKTNGEMKKIRVYKKVRKARKKLSTILWVEILKEFAVKFMQIISDFSTKFWFCKIDLIM